MAPANRDSSELTILKAKELRPLQAETASSTDSPRTQNLKFLRTKRVEYFIGTHETTDTTKTQETILLSNYENPLNGINPLNSPQDLCREAYGGTLGLVGERGKNDPDRQLLSDPCVPEHQKLRHVLTWAQNFTRVQGSRTKTEDEQGTISTQQIDKGFEEEQEQNFSRTYTVRDTGESGGVLSTMTEECQDDPANLSISKRNNSSYSIPPSRPLTQHHVAALCQNRDARAPCHSAILACKQHRNPIGEDTFFHSEDQVCFPFYNKDKSRQVCFSLHEPVDISACASRGGAEYHVPRIPKYQTVAQTCDLSNNLSKSTLSEGRIFGASGMLESMVRCEEQEDEEEEMAEKNNVVTSYHSCRPTQPGVERQNSDSKLKGFLGEKGAEVPAWESSSLLYKGNCCRQNQPWMTPCHVLLESPEIRPGSGKKDREECRIRDSLDTFPSASESSRCRVKDGPDCVGTCWSDGNAASKYLHEALRPQKARLGLFEGESHHISNISGMTCFDRSGQNTHPRLHVPHSLSIYEEYLLYKACIVDYKRQQALQHPQVFCGRAGADAVQLLPEQFKDTTGCLQQHEENRDIADRVQDEGHKAEVDNVLQDEGDTVKSDGRLKAGGTHQLAGLPCVANRDGTGIFNHGLVGSVENQYQNAESVAGLLNPTSIREPLTCKQTGGETTVIPMSILCDPAEGLAGKACGEQGDKGTTANCSTSGRNKLQGVSPGLQSRRYGERRHWGRSSLSWSSFSHGQLLPRSQARNRPSSLAGSKSSSAGTLRPGPQHEDRLLTAGRVASSLSCSPQQSHTKAEVLPPQANNLSEAGKCTNITGASVSVPWLSLPDELWMCILSLVRHSDLVRLATACHRLRHLAHEKKLWEEVRFEDQPCLTDQFLSSVGRHGPRRLTLNRCRRLQVTSRGLDDLFAQCKNTLQELKMISCSGPGFHGDDVLLSCSRHCSHLTAVDMSWTGVTDAGITALVTACASLEKVAVNGCRMTDEAIKLLIGRRGKSLRRLELFGCPSLSTDCLNTVAQNCPNLKGLNIGKIPKISNSCLTNMMSDLKYLGSLDLTGLHSVHDQTVHHIVCQCLELRSLTLSSCPHVTDASMTEISTYSCSIRHLDVSGCKTITDRGIQAIAMSSLQLQDLDLSLTSTGSRGVHLLANYCYRYLRTVKLSFCCVSQDAVRKLCRHCKRLRLLHLFGCHNVRNIKELKEINRNTEVQCDRSDHPDNRRRTGSSCGCSSTPAM
uniref:Uncharacterized LOC111839173 n=1 Tax=Paramormyrops kingsleyae TaxID=1676925 RepID=A0A3B3QDP0_9TELE